MPIDSISKLVGALEQGFKDVKEDIGEVKSSVKDIAKKVDILEDQSLVRRTRERMYSTAFGFMGGIAGFIIDHILKS